MLGMILRTVIIGFGIWLAAYLVPGVSANSTEALIWAAIALGLINAFVRPLLVLLTLPFTLLTLGHFIVLAFTPAEIAEFPGHYAPAVLTLVMDLLLQGAATTLQGGVILLVFYVAMLVSVGVFGILRSRDKGATTDAPDQAGG